jgi:hypothetical protein
MPQDTQQEVQEQMLAERKQTADDLSEVISSSASENTTTPAVGESQCSLMLLHV